LVSFIRPRFRVPLAPVFDVVIRGPLLLTTATD